jgi:oxygen-independent coproporphyrinogen III oxidase
MLYCYVMPNELSVYIHVPFCRRRCSYCSFVSYSGRETDIPAYVRSLVEEIRLRHIDNSSIKTIYFGGGTPSLLPLNMLNGILAAMRDNYVIDKDAEITLEANPGTVTREYLESTRPLGVNRLSLGVQSLNDAELRLLGRIHTADDALESIRQTKEAGFTNFSLDYIYGIPGRYIETWHKMLTEMVTLGAQHLSLYGLTLEDGTSFYARVKSGELPAPDPDSTASEYELAEEVLEAAGYHQYEISNWALPGFESRHNLAYWKRTPYLGLGVAAHSFLNSTRIANASSLDEYLSALSKGILAPQKVEVIGEAAALSEALFLGLRLNEGISADDIKAAFGIDLYRRFSSEIAECSSFGLLEERGGRLRLTPRGRLLGNEVFMRFLA